MKKKIASVLFGMAVAFALAIPTFAAQGTTACTADKTDWKRGDTVTFTVSAAEPITDRVFAVNMWEKGQETVAYAWDSDVFEAVGGEWLISVDEDAGMHIQDCNMQKGAAVFMCENEITVSGDLFRFTLRVKDDAPFGTYSVAPAIQFEGGDQLETRQAAQVQVFHECQGEYLYDDTHHWLECSVEGCTEEIVKVPHAYADDCDEVCDCGKTRVVTHSYELAFDAENHWQECSNCHVTKDVETHSYELDSDAENHWQECSHCHTKKEVEAHVYSADCDPDCNVCSLTRTPTAQHSYQADCATACTQCETLRADTSDHTYDSDQDTDCNECGEHRQLYTIGDIDGNKVVNQDDAIYLLLHTMFGEMFYPLNGSPGDIDRNGSINQDDAIYLLLHTMFGETFYPLTPA